MKFHSLSSSLTLLFAILPFSPTVAASDPAAVKSYLVKGVKGMKEASEKFVKNSAEYNQIIAKNKGDYAAALKADGPALQKLVEALREDYKEMDSFGYEKVEGIVGGVAVLADYDAYLDAGVPKKDASADSPAAPVTLKLAGGEMIDQEGCLFTFIIEPMLWGSNQKWITPIDLNGDGKMDGRESLPKAEVLVAAAADADKKIGELLASSQGWEPTSKDCFDAVIAMTPTLSGYFDDWKESRYSDSASGLFSAVSRVSDMKGIMSSVQVLYSAVDPLVEKKDKALSRSINAGFDNILQFVDRVAVREKDSGGKMTVSEIDEMARQATEKADKIVPQVEQAAALVEAKAA